MKNAIVVLLAIVLAVFVSGCGTPTIGIDRGEALIIQEDGQPPLIYQNGQLSRVPEQRYTPTVPVAPMVPVIPVVPVVPKYEKERECRHDWGKRDGCSKCGSDRGNGKKIYERPYSDEEDPFSSNTHHWPESDVGRTTTTTMASAPVVVEEKSAWQKFWTTPKHRPFNLPVAASSLPDRRPEKEHRFRWNFTGMNTVDYYHREGTRSSFDHYRSPYNESINSYHEPYSETSLRVDPPEPMITGMYNTPMTGPGSAYDSYRRRSGY